MTSQLMSHPAVCLEPAGSVGLAQRPQPVGGAEAPTSPKPQASRLSYGPQPPSPPPSGPAGW
jgi:hypothetical protein